MEEVQAAALEHERHHGGGDARDAQPRLRIELVQGLGGGERRDARADRGDEPGVGALRPRDDARADVRVEQLTRQRRALLWRERAPAHHLIAWRHRADGAKLRGRQRHELAAAARGDVDRGAVKPQPRAICRYAEVVVIAQHQIQVVGVIEAVDARRVGGAALDRRARERRQERGRDRDRAARPVAIKIRVHIPLDDLPRGQPVRLTRVLADVLDDAPCAGHARHPPQSAG